MSAADLTRAALVAILGLGCATPTADPLPLGSDSASCGTCHQDHYDEWAGSPHAGATRSPLLQAMLPDVEEQWGLAARQACEGCHRPAHSPGDDGIGCVSCHAATGNTAERDGNLVVRLERGIGGPLGGTESTPAHETRASSFLGSPSLCGTCHELTGPNLAQEPTLTEYRASPAASAGLTCADCHLPGGADRPWTDSSETPRAVTSHRFVGFDPPYGASPQEAAAAAERTRALLAAALELRVEPVDGGAEVIVTNVGAGHNVPTGATFLRDLWVDVDVDGELQRRVIVLGDQPMLGETPVALLTEADHVVGGSLPPGEERRVFIAADGTVEAFLRGRAVRDDVLTALRIEDLAGEIPTHEIQHTTGSSP